MLNKDSGSARPRKKPPAVALAAEPEEITYVRFAFQPLQVPHVVRVDAEGEGVLFVRFAAPVAGSEVIAVPPMLEQEVALKLREHRRLGERVDRVVVVGADPLFAGAASPTGEASQAEGWSLAVEALAGLFDALAAEQVAFTWRTRGGLPGTMPPPLSRALLDAREHATVEVGLPSLDPTLCRELEGASAALPEERLRLLTAVSARGVPVRGLLEPMVPMMNDQVASLEPLLQALADAGVHRVSARYLVLTHERARALTRRMSRMHRDLVQGIFAEQPWLEGDDRQSGTSHGPHKLLPAALRTRGHQRLLEVGARVGIVVDVLDAVDERASPAGEPSEKAAGAPKSRRRGRRERPQLDLFRARK